MPRIIRNLHVEKRFPAIVQPLAQSSSRHGGTRHREQGMEERMEIFREIIDKLLADYKGPEDLIGEQGMDGSSSSCYTSPPTNNSTKSSR
jgi:hypothetical protein